MTDDESNKTKGMARTCALNIRHRTNEGNRGGNRSILTHQKDKQEGRCEDAVEIEETSGNYKTEEVEREEGARGKKKEQRMTRKKRKKETKKEPPVTIKAPSIIPRER